MRITLPARAALLRLSMRRGGAQARPSSTLLRAISRAPATKPAVLDGTGAHTYAGLQAASRQLANCLPAGGTHPIAVYVPQDARFVTAILSVWQAGRPVVPLSPDYPPAALAPLLKTVSPSAILTTEALRDRLPPTRAVIITTDTVDMPIADDAGDPQGGDTDDAWMAVSECAPSTPSLIFFTSGTTGRPKGVVWTDDMLSYQLQTLSAVWRWAETDRILNVLPLNHIHGLVFITLSALYNQANLQMHTQFKAESVWSAFTHADIEQRPSVFMAVPRVYQKLIAFFQVADARTQSQMRQSVSNMRLFVCGSASLCKRDFDEWESISGHRILERYGMTEAGVILTNKYDQREAGLLGAPMPGMQVRLQGGARSELLVKGPGVFNQYWGDDGRTQEAFTEDGFFRTGDVVEVDEATGYFRMVGRANSDFVKCAGVRISTLEVERVLRDVCGVEVVVVGLPDRSLGDRIIAVFAREQVATRGVGDFLKWARGRAESVLPRAKLPREFVVVHELPRNALGKIQKAVLRELLTDSVASGGMS